MSYGRAGEHLRQVELEIEQLAHHTATAAGRARYKLRQQTVDPVFGIIKEAIGFRRSAPGGKPRKHSALPGSAKMAQPFYSSSAPAYAPRATAWPRSSDGPRRSLLGGDGEDEVRHAARAGNRADGADSASPSKGTEGILEGPAPSGLCNVLRYEQPVATEACRRVRGLPT
jgi:hypothetical protein